MNMYPEISVVIPVYNGRNLIGNTIESLLAQTFKNFEIVLVDDCSTDESEKVIKRYQEIDGRVVYFRTDYNLGIVPKVMNFARSRVRGRYFMYSSQDDHFSADMLEKLLNRAEETGADAVLPDVELHFPLTSDRHRIVGFLGNHGAVIDGKTAFLSSLNWSISGNALWKSGFLFENGYSDFGMYADEYTARVFFLKCHSVAFCDGVFFYNQGNPNSITKKVSPIRLDRPYNEYMIYRLIVDAAPDSEWRLKYCKISALALIRAEKMIVEFPELAAHRHRLTAAVDAMRRREFQDDLSKALISTALIKRLLIILMIRSQYFQRFFSFILARIGALR